jgi:hypothetical protein
MKRSSFRNSKLALEKACEFLRSFTLGRQGFTTQDGIAGIQRVTDQCNEIEKLFAEGSDSKEAKTIVASARPRISAARARLAIVCKDQ